MKILFTCHGNVNRSAAGEIILKKLKPEWKVISGSLREKHNQGKLTTKKMRETLNEMGYFTEGIRSTATTQEMIDSVDVVFYMDNSNEKLLISRFGDKVLEKSIRLSSLINEKSIPDPGFSAGLEMFKKVVPMIEKAIKVYIEQVEGK